MHSCRKITLSCYIVLQSPSSISSNHATLCLNHATFCSSEIMLLIGMIGRASCHFRVNHASCHSCVKVCKNRPENDEHWDSEDWKQLPKSSDYARFHVVSQEGSRPTGPPPLPDNGGSTGSQAQGHSWGRLRPNGPQRALWNPGTLQVV